MLRAGGRIRRGVAQGGRHEGCRGLGAAAAVGRLARHHDAAEAQTVAGLEVALSPAALTGDGRETQRACCSQPQVRGCGLFLAPVLMCFATMGFSVLRLVLTVSIEIFFCLPAKLVREHPEFDFCHVS